MTAHGVKQTAQQTRCNYDGVSSAAPLPPTALYTAQLLIGAVRDDNATEVRRLLATASSNDLRALAVTLAALIPYDQSLRQLLRWNDENRDLRGRKLRPHGTHAGHNRHRKHGEAACADCVEGERVYQQQRWARKRRASLRAAEQQLAAPSLFDLTAEEATV